MKIILKIFTVILVVIAVSAACLFFFVYIPGRKLYTDTLSLKGGISKLETSISNKDLKDAQVQIDNLNSQLQELNSSYQKFSYLNSLPYIRNYYADGFHLLNAGKLGLDTGQIVIQAVEPYQDFLGLKGSAANSGQTTQDRITFLTQSVAGLVPHMATINDKLSQIETELNQIDPNRYPDEFYNIPVKSDILQAQQTVSEVHQLVKNSAPILAKVPWLLGEDKPRNYFLIFQNDAELRPTGGFWDRLRQPDRRQG